MTATQHTIVRTTLLLAIVTTGSLQVSCSLPPKEAWQRIKNEGVLKALFVPRSRQVDSSRVASNTTWGSAEASGTKVSENASASTPAAPTAEVFSGRPGFVYSPHTSPKKLVNVSGFKAGEQVLCPYTLEAFVVPDYGQGMAPESSALASSSVKEQEKERFAPSKPKREKESSVDVVSTNLSPSMLPSTSGPPTGAWVEGRPGFVYSPFAAKHQLVDVTGIAPGVEVKCPYTGKIFRVPEMPATLTHQPESKPEPKPEPKTEPKPESKPEPKPEPKSEPAPEPKSEPAPTTTPAPSAPAPTPTADPSLPTAKWADAARGLVQSPFGQPDELVDVTGKAPGSKVLCPFTGKSFQVPAKP